MFTKLDDKVTVTKLLKFEDLGRINPKAKTRVYKVTNINDGSLLGHVKYFSYWRRYVFFPELCILDSKCMQQLIRFCDNLTFDLQKDWD